MWPSVGLRPALDEEACMSPCIQPALVVDFTCPRSLYPEQVSLPSPWHCAPAQHQRRGLGQHGCLLLGGQGGYTIQGVLSSVGVGGGLCSGPTSSWY